MNSTALITGIAGQDGTYLAELLQSRGYEVHGLVRATADTANVEHLADERLILHEADLTNDREVLDLVDAVRPNEIYNLAAPSFVPESWSAPTRTSDVIALGAARLLDAIRNVDPNIRFCQAGSSHMFGQVRKTPQDESTEFHPETPYAAAKCFAHWLTSLYRRRFELFTCSAVLFNHESPRRPAVFVSRKITRAAARIHLGLQSQLRLGNLDSARDWGFAGDYVRAMWKMLQHDAPDDYVIGTGQMHTVREFVTLAFRQVDLDWEEFVTVDEQLVRTESGLPLVADPSKARRQLGWQPQVTFDQLVEIMVRHDLDEARLLDQAAREDSPREQGERLEQQAVEHDGVEHGGVNPDGADQEGGETDG